MKKILIAVIFILFNFSIFAKINITAFYPKYYHNNDIFEIKFIVNSTRTEEVIYKLDYYKVLSKKKLGNLILKKDSKKIFSWFINPKKSKDIKITFTIFSLTEKKKYNKNIIIKFKDKLQYYTKLKFITFKNTVEFIQDDNLEFTYLTVYPNLYSIIFSTIYEISSYEYDETLSIINKFLPIIFVINSMKNIEVINKTFNIDFSKITKESLNELYKLQNKDGSFKSYNSFFINATIFSMFLKLQKLGFDIRNSVYEKFYSYILSILADNTCPVYIKLIIINEMKNYNLEYLDNYNIIKKSIFTDLEKVISKLIENKKSININFIKNILNDNKNELNNNIIFLCYSINLLIKYENSKELIEDIKDRILKKYNGKYFCDIKYSSFVILSLLNYIKYNNIEYNDSSAKIFINKKLINTIDFKLFDFLVKNRIIVLKNRSSNIKIITNSNTESYILLKEFYKTEEVSNAIIKNIFFYCNNLKIYSNKIENSNRVSFEYKINLKKMKNSIFFEEIPSCLEFLSLEIDDKIKLLKNENRLTFLLPNKKNVKFTINYRIKNQFRKLFIYPSYIKTNNKIYYSKSINLYNKN